MHETCDAAEIAKTEAISINKSNKVPRDEKYNVNFHDQNKYIQQVNPLQQMHKLNCLKTCVVYPDPNWIRTVPVFLNFRILIRMRIHTIKTKTFFL